jgi:hypothetical protein
MQMPGAKKAVRKTATAIVALCVLAPAVLDAATLRPSRGSLDKQNQEARRHDYTYLANGDQVKRFVDLGYLTRVPANGRNYLLKEGVSFPYSRPAVKLFIERLSAQYNKACGEKLVVTSLTRPKNRQPRNASSRSEPLGPPHRDGSRPAAPVEPSLPGLARAHTGHPRGA